MVCLQITVTIHNGVPANLQKPIRMSQGTTVEPSPTSLCHVLFPFDKDRIREYPRTMRSMYPNPAISGSEFHPWGSFPTIHLSGLSFMPSQVGGALGTFFFPGNFWSQGSSKRILSRMSWLEAPNRTSTLVCCTWAQK